MFQAHILWNKVESNAKKMYLYESSKIDILGMSQGNHPTGVFAGLFEDVRKMFLQNCKNIQQLPFNHFT